MRCWLRTTPWKPSVVSSAASPMQTIVPPGRSSSRPARRVACAPTASSTRSAAEVRAGLRGARRGRRARRARRRARAARRGARPRPRAGCRSSSAAWSVDQADRAGAEHHGVLDVGDRRSPTACTPLASGSIRAPNRADTPSGSTRASAAGTRDVVRERARRVDADQRAVRAEVAAGPRGTARSARSRSSGIDGHARALELRGARPRRHHPAGELVPHDQRRRAVAHVAEVALDLRAADPHRLGLQDQLALARIARARAAPRPSSADGPCQTIAFMPTTSTVLTSSPRPVIAIRTSSPPRSVNSGAGIDRGAGEQHGAGREVLRLEQPLDELARACGAAARPAWSPRTPARRRG